jgi:hypothetical protein
LCEAAYHPFVIRQVCFKFRKTNEEIYAHKIEEARACELIWWR